MALLGIQARAPRTAGRSASRAPCTGDPGGSRTWWWRSRAGEIVFDMHVTGACVMIFEEDAAAVLRDALIEWLG